MSNNTKKRFSFNVLDIFIILLVVILLASVAYKMWQNMKKDKNQTKPVYTVVFECEDYESLAKYLSNGEEVYISSSGELLGYVYKSITVSDENNSDLYEQVNLEGSLRLNGNVKKSREGNFYVLDDLNLTVGSKIDVYTDDTEFTITVKQFIDKKGN